jgi:hypothetical protein
MSWRRFFHRKRADSDLVEEIESHIAEELAENRSRGMPEEEAKRQARIKFGTRPPCVSHFGGRTQFHL